jgi:hypothetical protein
MPVRVYYGDDDYLVNINDAEHLVEQLPNAIGHKVPMEGFKHSDFNYAMYAAKLVHIPMVAEMDEFFADYESNGSGGLRVTAVKASVFLVFVNVYLNFSTVITSDVG